MTSKEKCVHIPNYDIVGNETGMSEIGMTRQVQKVTRIKSPGCLAMGKTGRASIVGWDLIPR